jgi:hypothetical protein
VNLPSASSLERAHLCPESQVLPHFRSANNAWSARGSAIHAFLVRVAEVGRDEALAELEGTEHFDACECVEVEKLPAVSPSSYAYEVALAYDLETDTARELARNVGREKAYVGVRPTEVFGTLDVLGLTDDAVLVLDYKTGFTFFGPIEENYQLLFGALAACRAYGRSRALMAIIRINEEGHPYFLWGEVGEFELRAFAARLRQLDDHIAELRLMALGGEPLRPTWGDHCTYCPALPTCPAHMTLVRAMTSPEDDSAGLPPLTEETAPGYIVALARGKKVLERIEGSLKLYAEQHPIDLGGGWRFGKYPFPCDEFNVPAAVPLLKGYLGEDALGTLKATIVKERIKDVYRARKKLDPKGPIRIEADTKTVLEALRNQRALTTRYTWPVGRHKPDPAKLEAANAAQAPAAAAAPTDTQEASNG